MTTNCSVSPEVEMAQPARRRSTGAWPFPALGARIVQPSVPGGGPLTTQLVAGGHFVNLNGVFRNDGVARWDGSAWQPVGGGAADCDAVTTFNPNAQPVQLIAGGDPIRTSTSGSSRTGTRP